MDLHYRELCRTSKMRAEIQMRSGHLFWAKHRQTSEIVGLGALFDEYWSSTKLEFTVPSQSRAPTSTLIADGED